MIIKVRVKPNSKKQEIVNKGRDYIVFLKSPPENNKANTELIKLLAGYFDKHFSQIKIKSGNRSRYKLVEIR